MGQTKDRDAAGALLSAYATTPGAADELFDPTGTMRPVWEPFVDMLSAMTESEVRARFDRGNQYLRDAGVYFRQYTTDPLDEREWPLSHIPVILDDAEWDNICAGLAQRADLLETVMADLYGAGRLVADGHIPAELIAGNPEWLRPMVDVAPRGGHYLHFLAFEIGRSPDGSWLVLGDRTQAPSGSGFALENRMATRRIFPEPYPRAHTHRLSGFFESYRAVLRRLSASDHGLPREFGILTPGRANDAFFEHFYIARYLGMLLLEGEDIVVRDGEAMVRTIEGPMPLGVLWRRIDAGFADPLELDPESRIGVPGLMEAVRSGRLTLVNALGSGVLETRALLAFLPRISRVLTGAPLALPNIATWWCGSAQELSYVRANADRMVLGPALALGLPFDSVGDATGGSAPGDGPAAMPDRLSAEAPHLVGQEAVTLSTTPSWRETPDGGRLVACPMTVRVFAARTEEGWTFLKGGYARIGPAGDTTALSMQKGGTVADVWIMARDPLAAPAPARPTPETPVSSEYGALPTRAADNLFWLGRYIIRFEDAARMLRAYHHRLASTGGGDDRLSRLSETLLGLGIDPDQPIPDGLVQRLSAARGCAAKIRDRFSIDGWDALTDLSETVGTMRAGAAPGDDAARAMGVLLRKVAGFSGIVSENMYRFSGWRFLALGRSLERADGVAMALSRFADPDAPEGGYEIAVELGDSIMAHRRRHAIEITRETVVDMLALDAGNPRSLLFLVRDLTALVEILPGAVHAGRPAPLLRALLPLRTALETAHPRDQSPEVLAAHRKTLARVAELVTRTYLR